MSTATYNDTCRNIHSTTGHNSQNIHQECHRERHSYIDMIKYYRMKNIYIQKHK